MHLKKFSIVLALLFLGLSFSIFSCETKESSAFTNPTMKAFFDNNCSSCHSNGTYNAGSWLYDPSNDKSIQDHIKHIYDEVYVKKTMPPAGLSQADLAAFKSWYDAGHPSN